MAGRLPSVSGISQTSEPVGDAPRRPSLLSGGGGSELDPLEVQAGRQAVVGGGNLHGMAKLNRPHFTPQEMQDRFKFVPVLRATLGQIDGTVKPAFSHYRSAKTVEENLYDFGMIFYQELFERSPQIRDELFSSKPPELLATKLGEILGEAVRLLELQTPVELKEAMTEMCLRHIEYGLEEHHTEPFKAALIACIKRCVSGKGFKWSQRTRRAWEWSLTEITDLLIDGVTTGRPRVNTLQRSWIYMCERLYMEDYQESRMARSSFAGGTSMFGGSQLGASQFGPNYKSMLGDDLAVGGKVNEGPKTIKIGNEEVTMPEKKSLKSVSAKKKANKTQAQLEREKQAERKRRKAEARAREADKAGKKEGMSLKLLAARTVGALRVGLTSLVSSKREEGGEGEFRMWSKKDLMMGATKEYQKGRDLVGERFIKVFAQSNPWAVTQFDFGLKPDHAPKMGEALELIVNSSTKPQVLQHKLRVLSVQHVQMGVKTSMFASFEEALFEFLKDTLGEYGQWNKPTEQSWRWMWGIVLKAFTAHMDSAEGVVSKVERSWKYIEDNYDVEDISDVFFMHFFHQAPSLQAYFVKPTKMQRVMFTKAVELIVASVRDTQVLNVELKGMAMRHIKYDITSRHLKIFGEVLLRVFRETVGEDHWDEEVEEAWLDVYSHIAEIFHHIISTGKNLVSRALATGNPEELRKALDTAPRGKRVRAALEIETDDSVISPIVWTLQEGQMSMAEELLRDALTIRGDRENYYCGRERLWVKHPWLVRLLVDKAPQLLTVLLDGHLWCSRFTEDGHRRVNYYVAELYGDPEKPENWNAYNTALGVFVSKLPLSELSVFGHPVVIYLVDLKWKQFGLRKFLSLQVLNLLNLALGTGYLFLGDTAPKVSFALALVQLIIVLGRILSYGKAVSVQMRYRTGVVVRWPGGRKGFVPYALADPFMILNFVSSVLCVALFALTWRADPFEWKPALMPSRYPASGHDLPLLERWADLAAFASGLLWVQLVEGFKLTKTMSAMLFAIIAVFGDVVRFLFILLLWSTGIAFVLYWLFVGQALQAGQDLRTAMAVDIGDGHTDPTAILYFELMSYVKLTVMRVVLDSGWDVRLVFGLAVWSSVMVLLNLLVSNMVYNYLNLYRSFAELAVRARAELVVRAEEIMSRNARLLHYDRCMFHNKCDFDPGDDGLAGGLQEVVPIQQLTHPAFEVLDRVERYSGSTAVEAPWDLLHLHSGPTTDKFASTDAGLKPSTAEPEEGGPVDLKLLRRVMMEVQRMHQELFVLKRALKLTDDDAASVATSENSSASALADLDDFDGGGGGGGVSAVDALLGVSRGGRLDSHGGTDDPERPSTARRALTAAQQMAADMALLQTRMADMAREMEELRALKAAAAVDTTTATTLSLGSAPPAEEAHAPKPLREVQQEELEAQRGSWMAVDGLVYDVSGWAAKHPGGKDILLTHTGRDSTTLFGSAHVGRAAKTARDALLTLPVVGRLRPVQSLRSRSSNASSGLNAASRRPPSGGSMIGSGSLPGSNSRRTTPSSAPMIDLDD